MVELTRSDDTVTFAISPEAAFCQVTVLGAGSAVAHKKLRSSLSRLHYKFEPDPTQSFNRDGVQVETLNTRLDAKTTLFVQFIRAIGPAANMAGFQIGALEQ
jgi:hypothetical protein